MNLLVTGTRGIPNVLGGIETHCEALYPRLADKGINITVIRREPYVCHNTYGSFYEGVHLVDISTPTKKSVEAIVHTVKAVWYARVKGYKYIHIHGIGPSLAVPFARLLGLKVVMTHHGPDYDRQKWGKIAKASLKLGEWCAARFANEIIVISKPIDKILRKKYHRTNAHLIPNGVQLPLPETEDDFIRSKNLTKNKYIIAVGRIVPEKGLHDLIKIAKKINPEYKVVIVGDADHETCYSKMVFKKAAKAGIVTTGFIKGRELAQIFSHAALFVMPSYHEGLPIALLEALSYNLKVVVSNIPANREVNLEVENYFHVGDTEEFARKINEQLNKTEQPNYTEIIQSSYNWDSIARQTHKVYRRLMN